MGDDLPARIRAARAYVDMNQEPFAKLIGSNKNRVREMETGAGEAPSENEMLLIAKHSGLPMDFFTTDWADLTPNAETTEQLDRIEAKIDHGVEIVEGLDVEGKLSRVAEDVREALERGRRDTEGLRPPEQS